MFSNLQIRPAKPHRRKPSMATRSGVMKRRVSQINTSVNDIPSMSFMEDLFGDEFPEAFAGRSSQTARSNRSINDLPTELLTIIAQHLSKLDLKRLRLAGKYLATHVDLRIDRLYVSPNRANLECLRKILGHPRHRFNVVEIVWDDAQLDEYPTLDSFRDAIAKDEYDRRIEIARLLEDGGDDSGQDSMGNSMWEHEDYFDDNGRLTELAKGLLLRRGDQASRDVIARYTVTMSVEDSYKLYQRLYREEQDIMKQGIDATALQHALALCPNLERVTITSEIWRPWNFRPAYSTPFYRSLPHGFQKPSVWPWLGPRPHPTGTQSIHRATTSAALIRHPHASLPHEYRGYTIVVAALLSMPSTTTLSELIIYPANEPIGIGHQLFATPNADLTNTLALAATLPLTRLKLSINANTGASYEWMHSCHLRAVFDALRYLAHLDFSPNCVSRRGSAHAAAFPCMQVLPRVLRARIKTFALRNASVMYDDLLALVTGMSCATHITLDNIPLHSPSTHPPTYARFAQALWRHYRNDAQGFGTRPAFTVIEPVGGRTRARLVSEELDAYLYEGEEDGGPFVEGRGRGYVRGECGWVVDDRDGGFGERGGGLGSW